MSLSGYERVYRAIHFQTPDRLPISMSAMGIDDLAYTGVHFDSERARTGVGPDEWGCVWHKTEQANMGQIVSHPLTDWRDLDRLPFPDPDCEAAYAHIPAAVAAGNAEWKYQTCGHFMLLFERMHALRGFQQTLEDLYAEPELCAELADRLVEHDIRVIRNVAQVAGKGIHSYGFSDDWGTQQACFISRAMWQDFFKPRYQRIFDAIHAQGWDVWMHSCGKVNEIIEDLIDIGLDVINLQQPRALGIEEIGASYAGRITFQALCDIQHTLPFKSDAEIREEARLLFEHWATPQGGFILCDYGDGEAIGVPLDKKQVMFDAFREFDPWVERVGV